MEMSEVLTRILPALTLAPYVTQCIEEDFGIGEAIRESHSLAVRALVLGAVVWSMLPTGSCPWRATGIAAASAGAYYAVAASYGRAGKTEVRVTG